MRLLRCPPGYIGTRVGSRRIYIDKHPYEDRGYTLVDDNIATELLKREGYEVISKEDCPRSLDDLYHEVKLHLTEKGVFERNNVLPPSTSDISDHPNLHATDGQWVETSTTKVTPTTVLNKNSSKSRCVLCKIQDSILSLVRKVRKGK